MMTANFNPIAIQIGFIAIHWYALAYLAGFLLGWRYVLWLITRNNLPITRAQLDDFLSWAIVGVLLGGRLGYTLFYNTGYYANHPLEILYLWQGGMSFHGGMTGVVVAVFLFAHKQKINSFLFGDLIAAAAPIGLFFGRIANFINGELYGRPTTAAWGVIFPRAPDALPRHPSQLYEGGLEGFLLFFVLFTLITRTNASKCHGRIAGIFLIGYATSRFMVEYLREPDQQIGFLYGGVTMGQLLCIPMLLFGLWVLNHSRRTDCPS